MKFGKKFSVLLLIFSVMMTTGFGCKNADQEVRQEMTPVTIDYWRVFDGPDAFADLISDYNTRHPYVKINYRKLRFEEYESELLDAMAEDRGPDIFTIHNTWINKYKTKLTPMPASTAMIFPVQKGSLKKEIVYEKRNNKSLNPVQLKNVFIDAVFNDVVIRERTSSDEYKENIYGLPLSVDTLALYYNRSLLNNAGIAAPPKYWNREFQQNVKRLTKQNIRGEIIQSGIAMGGGENIERSVDILATLMMQNGAEMVDENNYVVFNQVPDYYKNQRYHPGLEALRFYSDFANSSKEVYSWNDDLEGSLEMFIQGKLAYMLGYAYHLPVIKTSAPKLNFGIASLPQIEGSSNKINFANYWVEVVSRKSDNINEAWDFVKFITNKDNVSKYLEKVNKPSAIRELASSQVDDEVIGIFADQVLTAKTWYRGKNAIKTEEIINEMIYNAKMVDNDDMKDLLNLSASRVNQTIR